MVEECRIVGFFGDEARGGVGIRSIEAAFSSAAILAVSASTASLSLEILAERLITGMEGGAIGLGVTRAAGVDFVRDNFSLVGVVTLDCLGVVFFLGVFLDFGSTLSPSCESLNTVSYNVSIQSTPTIHVPTYYYQLLC